MNPKITSIIVIEVVIFILSLALYSAMAFIGYLLHPISISGKDIGYLLLYSTGTFIFANIIFWAIKKLNK